MYEILNNLEKTKKIAEFLEKEQIYALQEWESDEVVQITLHRHNIEPGFFVHHFGARVLRYFIGVLKGENEIGTCPAMIALLLFFRQKNIKLEEVFLCCATLKNIIINTVIEKKGQITTDELKIISRLFDLNFAGVIHEYLQKRFCRINCIEESKHATSPTKAIVYPSVEQTNKSSIEKQQIFASEYEREDIDEFVDLEHDIISISDNLNFSEFNLKTMEMLAPKLSKYGSIILTNYDFNAIGNSVLNLAKLFNNSENYQFISNNIESIAIFINCFINDLILWRKSLLETGIEDPHYFDRSIISNVDQIVNMIEGGENIDEGEGFEFF